MQIERVSEYLATLAKEGILPDEFEEKIFLEEDIEDLMYGENSAFQLAYSLEIIFSLANTNAFLYEFE